MMDWLRWPRPRFELVDEPKSREEAPPSPWRPIETAPKVDSERLLLVADGHVVIGWWAVEFYAVPHWRYSEDEGPVCWGAIEPTHWMPLPEPPQ